jgi:thioester reductase-like protein
MTSSVVVGVETFPLSFAQERLWFSEQLDPGTSQFTISSALHVTGRLDEDRLRSALTRLIGRHEAMRTRFVDRGHGPVQEVLDRIDLPLRVLDLSDRPAALDEIAARHANTGFDLATAPALRITLVQVGGERSVLLVAMHHIICDGVAADILLRDLTAFYTAEAGGPAAELPELEIQYGDFARWQRENIDETLVGTQLEFWSHELSGTDGHLSLPTDRARPPAPDHVGAELTRTLPAEQAAALLELARRESVSPFMLVLAAYELALARASGDRDFCIGTTVGGRSLEQVADVFGCFVNVVPIRSDLGSAATVGDLLQRVRQRCLRAYAHSDVPFERIVEHIRPSRDPARTPLFDVMLAVQIGRSSPILIADLAVRQEPLTPNTAQYDLALDVKIDGTGADLALAYATALFDESTARELLDRIVQAAEELLGGPGQPLSGMPEVAPRPDDSADEPWAEVMRSCLDRDGDGRIRITDGDSLYPGWLVWQTAQSAAGALRHLGVGRGDRVGLHLRRGADALAATLGVFLAGGCAVPLDPRARRSLLREPLDDPDAVVVTDDPEAVDGPVLPWSQVGDNRLAGPAGPGPAEPHDAALVPGPDAAAMPAGAVAHEASAVGGRLGLGASDTVVMPSSAPVLDVLSVLVADARIVFARPEPAQIAAAVTRHAASAAWLSGPAWAALLDTGWVVPAGWRIICRRPVAAELAERLAGPGGSVLVLVGGEPMTQLESRLLDAFRTSLDRDDVGVHDDFFASGGTSLSAARLAGELVAAAGTSVPVRMLFDHPTVAGLAAALAETAADTDARTGLDDARRDQILPPDISPAGQPWTGPARRVLVTGATGFIGAHLAAELTAAGSEVVCLARADGDAQAAARVRGAFERYRIDADPARITAVAGDLEAPLLGLAERRFLDLGDSLDAIFHSGALVSFGLPYRALAPPNVGGTVEILRLAATARPSAVHFVSTLDARLGPRLLEEPMPIDAGTDEGYVLTKKVAEHLVLEAGRRGLPVGVYRPGLVTASSRTGATNLNDQVALCLAGSMIAGMIPDRLPYPLHVLPVDHLVRQVVALAGTTDPDRPIYQLFNDETISLDDVRRHLGELGYPLEVRPFDQWRVQIARRSAGSLDELTALLAVDPGTVAFPELIDTANARRRLGEQPAEPVFDTSYVRHALEFLVGTGIVPARSPAGAR